MRLVVIGGGLAGLAAAHHAGEIARERGRVAAITVLEATSRVGGVIATDHENGFLLELGPDSLIREKPWAIDLCRRLGLESELLPTRGGNRRTLVVRDGKLMPLPEGFQLLAPTRPLAVLESPLFSLAGKLGMVRDLVAPRGPASEGGDESLADFVRRRFGREVLERVAQPLVGGIYTADPEKLSIAATLPRFVEMERRHRSILLALRAGETPPSGDTDPDAHAGPARAGEASSGARFGLFFTLRRGMTTLIEALEAALPAGSVVRNAPVDGIEPRAGGLGWVVKSLDGTAYDADAVIVTTPAFAAAPLLAPLDGILAADLAAIPYASTAIVTLAFRRSDWPREPDFFGFVVPFAERRRIIAASISSVKYDARAPADSVLLRVFVGGALQPKLFDLPDDEMIAVVRAEISDLLGITAPPCLVRVGRWPRSMPQYHVGHLARVARIEHRVSGIPHLYLAGAAYRGVGMADAVRSAEAAARAAWDSASG